MKKTEKKIEIEIDGKVYPMYPTMGAFLIFKDETGHDISKMEPGDMADTIAYMYGCVKSACKREGVEFGLTLEEFANGLTMEDIQAATQGAQREEPETGGEGGKKKGRR